MVVSESQDNFTVLPLTPIANQTIRGSSKKTHVFFSHFALEQKRPKWIFLFEVQQLLFKECVCCKDLLMMGLFLVKEHNNLIFINKYDQCPKCRWPFDVFLFHGPVVFLFCFPPTIPSILGKAANGAPRFYTRILLGKMARNTRFFSITFGGISVLGWFQMVES